MRFWIIFAVALAVVLPLPFVGTSYAVSFTIQLLIFMALAYSWNLIGGYTGYPHFGQVSFFGVGAYVTSLLILNYDWHWLPAALLSGVVGALIALPLGGALLRLKGPFFAISMFGLTRIWESLAFEFDGITQGGTGLYLPPVFDQTPLLYTMVVIAFGLMLLTWRLDRSRLGLKLLAIREDERAADALGIKTTKLKVLTFATSAIAPAMVGGIYAVYLSFIDPATAFMPVIELTTIAMVLLGGLGTVLGPFIGAVLLSVVQEALWARYPEFYLGMVGVIVLVVVIFMPRGITPLLTRYGILPAGRGSFRRLADDRGTPETSAAPLTKAEATRG